LIVGGWKFTNHLYCTTYGELRPFKVAVIKNCTSQIF